VKGDLAAPSKGVTRTAAPPRALVPILIFISTVSSAVGSLGAPLLQTIARVDHISLANAQWSLTLPMLVGAVGAPVLGRLGDGPARRTVIRTTLGVVLVGSVLAAIPSGGFSLLLMGRGMQGLGFGLMPLTMAVARDSLPESRSGPAIALLSVAATAGVGLGFPITGLLDDFLGLHATFWFGAVVAGVALVLSWPVLPASSQRRRGPLDIWGASLLGAALLSLLLAITEAHSWRWGSARVVTLLAAAVVLGVLWTRHERSARYPLLDLRLLRHRAVAVTYLTGLLIALSMYMFLPLLTDFVQTPASAGYGFGSSVVVTGLMLVPFSVLSTSMSRVAARIRDRLGPERVVALGALLMAAATVLFTVTAGAVWEAFVATGIAGMGVGFSFAAMPGLIIRSVPSEETGSALGFYQVVRSVGFAAGSGISASILSAYTRAGHSLPPRSGFTVAMAVGAGVGVLAAAVSALLGRPAPVGRKALFFHAAPGAPDVMPAPVAETDVVFE
jgi:predicted MFS family arabinose efflux permease